MLLFFYVCLTSPRPTNVYTELEGVQNSEWETNPLSFPFLFFHRTVAPDGEHEPFKTLVAGAFERRQKSGKKNVLLQRANATTSVRIYAEKNEIVRRSKKQIHSEKVAYRPNRMSRLLPRGIEFIMSYSLCKINNYTIMLICL